MDRPECYICTGSVPAPWPSACVCTERYIHRACLLKLMASHHTVEKALTCSVCNQRYRNAQHCHVRRWQCAKEPACLWLFALINTSMVACACKIVVDYAHIEDERGHPILITASVYAASSAILWGVWMVYVVRSGPRVLCDGCTRVESAFRVWPPSMSV